MEASSDRNLERRPACVAQSSEEPWLHPPNDPATVVAAAVLVGVIAIFAGYLPARRATTIDPMLARRSD